MAIIASDFMQCDSCGNESFKEVKIVILPTSVRKRTDFEVAQPLPVLNERLQYECTNCKQILDK